MIERFITEIDARWPPEEAEKVVLSVIGSTALMLQAKYVRGTKDSDVFRTRAIDDALAERLMTLAGEGTDLHRRHRIYLQLVPSGMSARAAFRGILTNSLSRSGRHPRRCRDA